MPILKVGDFVEAGGKLTPGILTEMELKKIRYDIIEIDTNDPGAKLIECTIFYEDHSHPSYIGTTCLLSNNIKPVSELRYKYMNDIGEELLRILWWYWKKCEKQFSWEKFTELYYYNQTDLMKYIPVRKVISPKVIEFADGSIWLCDKIKYKSSKRSCREKKKKHHIYKPIKLLYGLHY